MNGRGSELPDGHCCGSQKPLGRPLAPYLWPAVQWDWTATGRRAASRLRMKQEGQLAVPIHWAEQN